MISEQVAKDERRVVEKELKRALHNRDYEEVVRLQYYLDFLDFILNWKED